MLLPYGFRDIMPYQLGETSRRCEKIVLLCGLVVLVFSYFSFISFWGRMFSALHPLLLITIEVYAKKVMWDIIKDRRSLELTLILVICLFC